MIARRTALHAGAAILLACVSAAPLARAQSIFDAPKPTPAPAAKSSSLGRKRAPAGARKNGPARYSSPSHSALTPGTQSVVLPPVDVALDEDTVCPVVTRLGLITVFEFPEEISYIWFSDSDRWRLEQDAFQLGISPGKGDDVTIKQTKWNDARETLYVRVSDGFTYKFALSVAANAPNSFVRVHRKTPPPPPGPSAEEIAREREADEKRAADEEKARAAEAERVARESALAAARALPLAPKGRKAGDVECRLARPVTISGVTYLAFELSNRGKVPLAVAAVLASASKTTTAPPPSEIVIETTPLPAGARRTGVLVLRTSTIAPRTLALHLQPAQGKALELPLGE